MANVQPNRVRTGGLLTTFTFGGQPIAFCQQVAHQSPQPVGQGASAIQPMDEPYPIEIITPYAAGMGQLTLNLFELFGSGGSASKVWDRLGSSVTGVGSSQLLYQDLGEFASASFGGGYFANASDIVDIFIIQAQLNPNAIEIVKYINPLTTTGTASQNGTIAGVYTEHYHGCRITNVVDGESVDITSLEILKQITVAYRYNSIAGRQKLGFRLRDNVTNSQSAVT